MYTIKKLNQLVRCFNEIEEFSLNHITQKKIVEWLRSKCQSNNRLQTELRKIKHEIELEKMEKKTKIQSIIVTLSDGKQYTFTGVSLPEEGRLVIEDIKFSRPFDLPEGMEVSTIENTGKK